jgi:anti-anti-sigma factor
VTSRLVHGGTILALSGELDMGVTAGLNAYIDTTIGQGLTWVVLDLSGLEFCDCAGLAAFLRARRLTIARHGWSRLADVPPRVARIIRIARLDTVLHCYRSTDDAFNDAQTPARADGDGVDGIQDREEATTFGAPPCS